MLRDAMLASSLHNCEMIAANQPVAAQNSPLSSVILWVRHSYLNLLKHIGAKYDKGFCRRYKQLTDYVFQKKIKLPDCNISNEYHVYEIAPK